MCRAVDDKVEWVDDQMIVDALGLEGRGTTEGRYSFFFIVNTKII